MEEPKITEKQAELLDSNKQRTVYLGGRGNIGSALAAAALLAGSATRFSSSLYRPPQIKFGKQVARLRTRRVFVKSNSIYSPHSSLLQQIKGLKQLTRHHEPLVYDNPVMNEDGDFEPEFITKPCDCDKCKLLKQLKAEYEARKANKVTSDGTAR